MSFVLTRASAAGYLLERGLVSTTEPLDVAELVGGVSATVIAVRGPGVAMVVKQALPRLKVDDEWLAKQERTLTEAAAMQLCGELTPGAVPRVLDVDPQAYVVVLELVPEEARNWQEEIAHGRVHPSFGPWAGETLGTWHARTTDDEVAARFDDFEAFEQLRLRPFHETVVQRLPEAAVPVEGCLADLRESRSCLVHGDYAKKNMLVAVHRGWVLDFEVAHVGNPVFDLGFFLSFVVLSAIRWPALAESLEQLGRGFLAGYAASSGTDLAEDVAQVTAHTASLVLARTDGTSPAQFLDEPSRRHARERGLRLLASPDLGLWT